MGNTERQSERSTEVFGDLLYSARDSKHRAIRSLGIAALALPFAFRKGQKALPIIAASAFGVGALVNHLEALEKKEAADSLISVKIPQTEKPQSEKPISHEQTSDEFTLETSEEFMVDMISSIEHAKNRVWLEFMQFESGEVMSQLVDALIAAKERGVDVNFYLDPYAKNFIRVGNRDVWRFSQILRNPKEPVSDLKERTLKQRNRFTTEYDIEKMQASGIVVFPIATGIQKYIPFVGGGNHRKFAIVDDTAWLGTSNLTDADISGMDNFMLRAQSAELVSVLENIFTNPPQQDTVYRSSQEQVTNGTEWELLVDTGKPNQSAIYDRALEMIEEAEEKIEFVTQYWPKGKLEQALIKRAKEGLEVKVVIQTHGDHRLWRYPFKIGFQSFMRYKEYSGLEILLPKKSTHTKGLVVDGKKALFGSNDLFDLSKIAGVKEVSLYTENPDLVEQINGRIFNHQK